MILIFGQNGQLGTELCETLKLLDTVVGVDRTTVDLTNPAQIRRVIDEVQPSVIINAAAYTNVKQAEIDVELAEKINGEAPKIMAQAADKLGALMIHYSTDYVYDGSQQVQYLEDVETNPLNSYGRSKLQGDLAVQAACERHLILRTSWVAGAKGNNFVKAILKQALSKDQLTVVDDQFGNPSLVSFLVRGTAHAMTSILKDKVGSYGTYHLCGSGTTNWFEYARTILMMASDAEFQLKATADNVVPVKTIDQGVKRPMFSGLNTEKFCREFNTGLYDWRVDLEYLIWELKRTNVLSSENLI